MMSQSRKQLLAQIAWSNRTLQQRQAEVNEHKKYLQQGVKKHSGLILIGLLIPSLWIGGKISQKKWVNKIAFQLTELVTLTFFTYFRKQLMTLFIK